VGHLLIIIIIVIIIIIIITTTITGYTSVIRLRSGEL